MKHNYFCPSHKVSQTKLINQYRRFLMLDADFIKSKIGKQRYFLYAIDKILIIITIR